MVFSSVLLMDSLPVSDFDGCPQAKSPAELHVDPTADETFNESKRGKFTIGLSDWSIVGKVLSTSPLDSPGLARLLTNAVDRLAALDGCDSVRVLGIP